VLGDRLAIGEADKRVLIHPQAFLDIPLRKGARREVCALGVLAQTRDGRIVQADAQRVIHVVHCSAVSYSVQMSFLQAATADRGSGY